MIHETLRVENLSLQWKEGEKITPILHNLSFSLNHNRVLGVVGESGAGKSMLMHTLTNLLIPRKTIVSGEIIYKDGLRIGFIPQDAMNALNPYEKINHQLIRVIRKHHSFSKIEAERYRTELLRNLGLAWNKEQFDVYPHQFSGGMRQRIVIAMVFASKPKLIIADEPTTALDALNQQKFMLFLKNMCRQYDVDLMYSSHDLNLVSTICDDIMIMQKGRIVEQGRLETVFRFPKSDYTKTLLRATRNLYGG